MKNVIIKTITLGAAIVLSLAGAVGANAGTKTYGYKHFTKLELGRAVSNIATADYNKIHFGGNKADRGDNAPLTRVRVIQSETYGVEISVEEQYADLYNIVLHNDVLEVVVKRYNVKNSEKARYKPVADVTIYMPVLTSLTAQGLTEITIDGEFETEGGFRLNMSGATKLENLKFKSEGAVLDFSGAAAVKDIDVTASKKISLDFSGAADVDGLNLEAEELKADFSGAANVYNGILNAGELTLKASGAANVKKTEVALKEAYIGVSGAANVKFDAIMENAGVTASGAAYLSVDGEAEKAKINASGAAKVDLSKFLCKEVIVEASGIAKVDFNATEKATYSSSGQATVRSHGKNASVSTENGKTTVRMGYDD